MSSWLPQGAATTCYVAMHPQLKQISGEYFSDCNVAKPTSQARDASLAERLWEFSMNLIKTWWFFFAIHDLWSKHTNNTREIVCSLKLDERVELVIFRFPTCWRLLISCYEQNCFSWDVRVSSNSLGNGIVMHSKPAIIFPCPFE